MKPRNGAWASRLTLRL